MQYVMWLYGSLEQHSHWPHIQSVLTQCLFYFASMQNAVVFHELLQFWLLCLLSILEDVQQHQCGPRSMLYED